MCYAQYVMLSYDRLRCVIYAPCYAMLCNTYHTYARMTAETGDVDLRRRRHASMSTTSESPAPLQRNKICQMQSIIVFCDQLIRRAPILEHGKGNCKQQSVIQYQIIWFFLWPIDPPSFNPGAWQGQLQTAGCNSVSKSMVCSMTNWSAELQSWSMARAIASGRLQSSIKLYDLPLRQEAISYHMLWFGVFV